MKDRPKPSALALLATLLLLCSLRPPSRTRPFVQLASFTVAASHFGAAEAATGPDVGRKPRVTLHTDVMKAMGMDGDSMQALGEAYADSVQQGSDSLQPVTTAPAAATQLAQPVTSTPAQADTTQQPAAAAVPSLPVSKAATPVDKPDTNQAVSDRSAAAQQPTAAAPAAAPAAAAAAGQQQDSKPADSKPAAQEPSKSAAPVASSSAAAEAPAATKDSSMPAQPADKPTAAAPQAAGQPALQPAASKDPAAAQQPAQPPAATPKAATATPPKTDATAPQQPSSEAPKTTEHQATQQPPLASPATSQPAQQPAAAQLAAPQPAQKAPETAAAADPAPVANSQPAQKPRSTEQQFLSAGQPLLLHNKATDNNPLLVDQKAPTLEEVLSGGPYKANSKPGDSSLSDKLFGGGGPHPKQQHHNAMFIGGEDNHHHQQQQQHHHHHHHHGPHQEPEHLGGHREPNHHQEGPPSHDDEPHNRDHHPDTPPGGPHPHDDGDDENRREPDHELDRGPREPQPERLEDEDREGPEQHSSSMPHQEDDRPDRPSPGPEARAEPPRVLQPPSQQAGEQQPIPTLPDAPLKPELGRILPGGQLGAGGLVANDPLLQLSELQRAFQQLQFNMLQKEVVQQYEKMKSEYDALKLKFDNLQAQEDAKQKKAQEEEQQQKKKPKADKEIDKEDEKDAEDDLVDTRGEEDDDTPDTPPSRHYRSSRKTGGSSRQWRHRGPKPKPRPSTHEEEYLPDKENLPLPKKKPSSFPVDPICRSSFKPMHNRKAYKNVCLREAGRRTILEGTARRPLKFISALECCAIQADDLPHGPVASTQQQKPPARLAVSTASTASGSSSASAFRLVDSSTAATPGKSTAGQQSTAAPAGQQQQPVSLFQAYGPPGALEGPAGICTLELDYYPTEVDTPDGSCVGTVKAHCELRDLCSGAQLSGQALAVTSSGVLKAKLAKLRVGGPGLLLPGAQDDDSSYGGPEEGPEDPNFSRPEFLPGTAVVAYIPIPIKPASAAYGTQQQYEQHGEQEPLHFSLLKVRVGWSNDQLGVQYPDVEGALLLPTLAYEEDGRVAQMPEVEPGTFNFLLKRGDFIY